MSEYVVCETEMSDLAILKEALIDLGVSAGHIECHDEPIRLTGYTGDQRKQTAHVVVKRRNVGSMSNDIGFERVGGKYKVWVSAFDKAHGLGKRISERISQSYAKQQVLQMVRKKPGCKVTSMETSKDGKVRIRMRLS